MIVYNNEKFEKKSYRTFNLKNKANSDYDSMKEVIMRRYSKLSSDEYPSLIMVDGGLIQVNAANEILESLNITIPVLGLAKDEHHRLSYLCYNHEELELDKHSSLFVFVGKIDEEVHRFAINFHRSKRNSSSFDSIFDNIKGIGKIKKDLLLKNFESIEDIYNSEETKLLGLGINKKDIVNIKDYLKGFIQ
jgi:excinuclease ABC subunit C